jgi:hypothetical protein
LSTPPVNKIAHILRKTLKELLAQCPGSQGAGASTGAAHHAEAHVPNSILLECAESVYTQLEATQYNPENPDEFSDVSRFMMQVCMQKG